MNETIEKVTDVVCGMEIIPAEAAATKEYGWRTYHFCSQSCFMKFSKDSEKYAGTGSDGDRYGGHSTKGTSCCSVPPKGEGTGGCCSSAAGEKAVSAKPADTRATYVCPMDPEVREIGPGSCPKCGMALDLEEVKAAESKTEYVCPMHPEVVQDHPGSCPKCGMALEPRTVTLDDGNPGLDDMLLRLKVSSAGRFANRHGN